MIWATEAEKSMLGTSVLVGIKRLSLSLCTMFLCWIFDFVPRTARASTIQ
jgi:hypothetical protein